MQVTSRGQTFEVSDMSDLPEKDEEVTNMTIGSCCSSYNGACPEVVPVTINENTYDLDGDIEFDTVTFTLSGSDNVAASIPIQVVDSDGNHIEDVAEIRLRFVDSLADKSTPTAFSPTLPGWSEKLVHTDALGAYTLPVEYAGAMDTWYLVVVYHDKPNGCPTALTLGV